jgi:hypothetical protein
MTSTIKVNTVTTESGSTLTLGESGKTVTLASGASQTGFGRTGTVNWVTTKKTANFTAVSGEGYFCDTAASGAFTLTLPSSPSAGDIVGLKDYNGNFATANLTIGRGGSPINGGSSANPVIDTDGASIFLVYVDASQGWVATQDDSSTFSGNTFTVATGGTITTCGNFKIHAFTGPGTFTVCSVGSGPTGDKVNYLVVAGGGSGGTNVGGAGGAGGFRMASCFSVTATGFPITVGAGAAAPNSGDNQKGLNGSNSIFSSITSTGGGGGGTYQPCSCAGNGTGIAGGSGGGGVTAEARPGGLGPGGAGNTPPVSPPQGNAGGPGSPSPAPGYTAGGGGGAAAVGGTAPSSTGGTGGAGSPAAPIFGAAPKPFYIANVTNNGATACGTFAGGGGGGAGGGASAVGAGGLGGGGRGSKYPGAVTGTAGTTNSGGGGGGGDSYPGPPGGAGAKAGGSGIVLIRYRFQ